MNPEETYLKHLRTIERIAASVARRYYLDASEAEEFVQVVRVRLLEDNYAILRKFEGRSELSTFLTTVIGRLFQQWRVEHWGKWRNSAEAKRLGKTAIILERLISRDGYTFDEAVRHLTTPGGSPYTLAELEAIYQRLPDRMPRPMIVSDDVIPDIVTVEDDGYHRMEAEERAAAFRRAAKMVDELLEKMAAEDRLILQMRFWDGRNVPDIARTLHLDQKKLYKRLERLYRDLRVELVNAGVSPEVVAGLTGDDEENPS
ncbi:MAG TPA: sigma-70 family RNA polymerase sigma factor [Thermoanaerobaculia bacterium]|jgi:RNA polymerase sigma factor for flagellar operon FliA|nr:sigma-70 family RNA polymerase sigma factor [Thermoanaerobaculia bacterium]